MTPLTIKNHVSFASGKRSRKELRTNAALPPVPGRVPRVANLMALALRFENLVCDGVVTDYAELARLGHVTRARLTQIMNLLTLAPDIQEAILFLPRVTSGKDPITERELRRVVATLDWEMQRAMWKPFVEAGSMRCSQIRGIHQIPAFRR